MWVTLRAVKCSQKTAKEIKRKKKVHDILVTVTPWREVSEAWALRGFMLHMRLTFVSFQVRKSTIIMGLRAFRIILVLLPVLDMTSPDDAVRLAHPICSVAFRICWRLAIRSSGRGVAPFYLANRYRRFGESCSLLLEMKEEGENLGGHKKPTSVLSMELTQGLSSAY